MTILLDDGTHDGTQNADLNTAHFMIFLNIGGDPDNCKHKLTKADWQQQ